MKVDGGMKSAGYESFELINIALLQLQNVLSLTPSLIEVGIFGFGTECSVIEDRMQVNWNRGCLARDGLEVILGHENQLRSRSRDEKTQGPNCHDELVCPSLHKMLP